MEDRVSVDLAICGSKPTIRRRRIMLKKNILGMRAGRYRPAPAPRHRSAVARHSMRRFAISSRTVGTSSTGTSIAVRVVAS